MSGQCARLLALLRSEPSVSSLDIVLRLNILNTTGRVSDLRAEGFDVQAKRDSGGVWRYRLIEPNGTLGL